MTPWTVITAPRGRGCRRPLTARAGMPAVIAVLGAAVLTVSGCTGPTEAPSPTSTGHRDTSPAGAGSGTDAPRLPAAVADPLPEPLVSALSAATGRDVVDEDVLVAAEVDGDRIVLLTGEVNEEEAAHGGKAAQMWLSRRGAPFTVLSDYLSYDLACEAGDEVCEQARPTGLGVMAVWQDAERSTVLVGVPDGRRPDARTAEGEAVPLIRAARGYVGTARTARPWEVVVTAGEATDSQAERRYRLPVPPGGVVTER